MHEHVFIMTTDVMQNYPEQWGDEAARQADAVERLNKLKVAGVDTIVDLTVIGLGRYIPRIARVTAAESIAVELETCEYRKLDAATGWWDTRPFASWVPPISPFLTASSASRISLISACRSARPYLMPCSSSGWPAQRGRVAASLREGSRA